MQVEYEKVTLLDPHNLAEDLDLDEPLEMPLVSFKASADMRWFLKTMNLGANWWWQHCRQLRLLREIRKIVKGQKATRGGASRLPRQSESMVLIKVRERTLFVKNQHASVTLGLRGTVNEQEAPPGSLADERAVLEWFVKELQKDVEHLEDNPESGDDLEEGETQEAGVPEEPEPEEGEAEEAGDPEDGQRKKLIEKILKTLKEHPRCKSAWWMRTRRCFRVRKGGKQEEFFVKSAKRKRNSEESAAEVERLFDSTLEKALTYLEQEESQTQAEASGERPEGCASEMGPESPDCEP